MEFLTRGEHTESENLLGDVAPETRLRKTHPLRRIGRDVGGLAIKRF